ncbi:protoporphyrinogen oxidase [Arthrobacter psychrolactophilus]|uniref:Coproporphyrinogen III oxidase n=1 Tax=Arthrobacter psychrolactophilus TaxID=92442 RepID=A0A2V5ILZ8_9MICC|nr:protoporphyrinogen oxidase [Arthrobacter psychrolactophilus]PYI37141.1 protoporphyrinogen oxidase [Arthrobacter psychrolactophilus]
MEHRKHAAKSHSHPVRERAVVVGGGVSGLLAAKELQAAGFQVSLYEAAATLGGCFSSHEVAGVVLDGGAESFATRSTAVADLAQELGLAANIVTPNPAGAWVWLPDGPVPLPRTGVLGIPSDLNAPEVRAALGASGVLRAALDAKMPATIGTTEAVSSVADLVRARMGKRVLERLVAPVVGGVHSADPELLDVDMVAPGLRAGIREHGSLAAAVAAQRAGGSKPGSAVGGLVGGMHTLVTALVKALVAAGVELHTSHRIKAIYRGEELAAGKHDGATSLPWQLDWEHGTERGVATAQVLVVATDGPTAVTLLGAELPQLRPFAPATGPDIRLVTLVVDVPELDSAPRGTGILVAPGVPGIKAKALTHATSKWAWLADSTGPGTHVLRLSYGRAGVKASDAVRLSAATPTEEDLVPTALADASTLLGLEITEADLLGSDIVRWRGALPFAAVGHQAKMAQVQALASEVPGLALTGGWLSGNGLAAVVAGTQRTMKALIESSAKV